MKKLEVGFHTGAFNSAYFPFWKAVDSARNHGLGYFPHLASGEDPREVRDLLANRSLKLSQLDAAFPISGRKGLSVAVPYVIHAIRWAALADCPRVDTTDGLYRPLDMTDEEAMEEMKRSYALIMESAEGYGIIVNIETHGYFTANPERITDMLNFVHTPLLRMTFDTGIGISASAIGVGVNADGIRRCITRLKEVGFSGSVSLECDARGGPLMEESLAWFRALLDELEYPNDLSAHEAEASS